MPNPFLANAEAAQYIEFLGSEEMQRAAVDRLYYGAIRHKQEVVRKVEDEVYAAPVPVVRTKKEIDAHLRHLVDEDVARRLRHRAQIEREMYGAAGFGTAARGHLDPERENDLVKRVYYDQKKRIERRKEVLRKRSQDVGPPVAAGSKAAREREAKFRTAVHRPPTNDGKMLLVSESVPLKGPLRSSSAPAERADRFKRLAQPLQVTPKRKVDNTPAFQLYTKYH